MLYAALWIVHASGIHELKKTSALFVSDELPRWVYENANLIPHTSVDKEEALFADDDGNVLYMFTDGYRYVTKHGVAVYDKDGAITECKNYTDKSGGKESYQFQRYENGRLAELLNFKEGVTCYRNADGSLLKVQADCTGMPDWLCKITGCRHEYYYDKDLKAISKADFDALTMAEA